MRTRTSEPPDLFNSPYTARPSGRIGQVIVDADGTIVCWTCDGALAGVLAGLLNWVADGSIATTANALQWLAGPRSCIK